MLLLLLCVKLTAGMAKQEWQCTPSLSFVSDSLLCVQEGGRHRDGGRAPVLGGTPGVDASGASAAPLRICSRMAARRSASRFALPVRSRPWRLSSARRSRLASLRRAASSSARRASPSARRASSSSCARLEDCETHLEYGSGLSCVSSSTCYLTYAACSSAACHSRPWPCMNKTHSSNW